MRTKGIAMLYVRHQDLVLIQQNRHRVEPSPSSNDWYVNDLRRRRPPLPSGPGQPESDSPADLPDVA